MNAQPLRENRSIGPRSLNLAPRDAMILERVAVSSISLLE
ncbi:hypothetical protein BC1002_6993 (plasmid) [Paraburkholderia atlantica]|uniref:Uncharacterized protein n=1 Tax=Paraburkholderia atlantica TaxID=2654982 RepID=D5WN98_PARAM|nr:hypothetical protein BC1002_6993 [Paraburkholderia atlantica]